MTTQAMAAQVRLIEAALDQPFPSNALKNALADVLMLKKHPARLK